VDAEMAQWKGDWEMRNAETNANNVVMKTAKCVLMDRNTNAKEERQQ